jgi:hypothetical protein
VFTLYVFFRPASAKQSISCARSMRRALHDSAAARLRRGYAALDPHQFRGNQEAYIQYAGWRPL